MNNTGFESVQEVIVIAEFGNSDMCPLHPLYSVISKTIRVLKKCIEHEVCD
jgi:hypothetical protein